jgi:hypothetical protein
MTRIVWSNLLRYACAFAAASCADALGLQDLLQGGDGGNSEAESTSLIGGGEDSSNAVSVPLDGGDESSDEDDGAEDRAVPTASALDGALHDAAVSDALDGGSHDAAHPDALAADAAQQVRDASTSDAQGGDAGCSGCGACTVHSNGVGQRFQDCMPNGTYNATQARAACAAFAGDGASCTIQSCPGGAVGALLGGAKGNQAACSTGASACDCWTFAGADMGLVQSASPHACEPCSKGGTEWN